MKKDRTLKEFSKINRERSAIWHGRNADAHWNGADWGNAMAGEAGEVCNEIKKLRRIECGFKEGSEKKQKQLKKNIGKEIADTICYLDLLAHYYGLDLEEVVVDKFNEVSDREGFEHKL